MVDAVLVILRETIEAALYVVMLLVMGRKFSITLTWIFPALLLGAFGSGLLAHYAYDIANALDGTGQEWTNAALYLCPILAFSIIASIITPLMLSAPKHIKRLMPTEKSICSNRKILISCAILSVGLSLAREITEIWLYLASFLNRPAELQSAIFGSVIGLGVGMSLGAIAYYLLVSISAKQFLYLLFAFLLFLCGGLSMQVAKELMQIGVLESIPVWSMSAILSEEYWPGEILYELTGYNSNPSKIQLVFCWLTVTPLLIALAWNWHGGARKDT